MSAAKRKGDSFERDCIAVLREHGHAHAERMLRLGAHRDDGDITGIGDWHVDCKAQARYQLSYWMDEVCRECSDGSVPMLIVKRPRKSADRAFVIIELGHFADVIARA